MLHDHSRIHFGAYCHYTKHGGHQHIERPSAAAFLPPQICWRLWKKTVEMAGNLKLILALKEINRIQMCTVLIQNGARGKEICTILLVNTLSHVTISLGRGKKGGMPIISHQPFPSSTNSGRSQSALINESSPLFPLDINPKQHCPYPIYTFKRL